jgi:hypothetical protein
MEACSMVIKGHVCDGVIVLDEQARLPEGVTVFVSLEPPDESTLPYRRYRGHPYKFESPLEPPAPHSDWESSR